MKKEMNKKANSRFEFLLTNRKMLNSKRSQSQIVGTVLLILLTIGSVVVVIGFVVPFVRDQLSGTECLDLVEQIRIENNPTYTCYDDSTEGSEAMRVQIYRGDSQNLSKSFKISISYSGSSKSIEIPTDTSDFSMYGGGTSEIPGINEKRTYAITGVDSLPESISVFPILEGGKTCDNSHTITSIVECG